MPELPEVETVRRALVPAMEGRRIGHAYVGRPDLRWPLPPRLAERLTGRRVGPLDRRGKFLLLPLDGDETMLMHLGMSGSVRIYNDRPETGVHDHMILEMRDGGHPQWVVFNDPRRFGWIDLFEGDIHPMLAGMGLGIPLISLITHIICARTLSEDGHVFWDRVDSLQYLTQPVGAWRWIFALVIYIVCRALELAMNYL